MGGRTTGQFRKKTHSTVLSDVPNELDQKKAAKPCPSHKYQSITQREGGGPPFPLGHG